jgi:hypothetical protein
MYKAFSQILADGRKVTSLNVLAINKKLINKEVDAASSPLQERITPLMSPLSKERAQSGPLGQLKDGTHIASLSEDELKTELAKRNGTDSSLRLPDHLPQPKRKNSESASSSSSRAPREVAPSAKKPKTSAAGQRLPHFSDCHVNGAPARVSLWGRNYVNVTALLEAFKAQFPKLPASQLQDYKILPSLLTSRRGDEYFRLYAPRDASDATMRALKSWYDRNKWQEFSVDVPPDFC